jgi:hypothetical protein
MAHNPAASRIDIQAARTREFEAAQTAAEVKALDEKWRLEDAAAEQAQSWQARQAADHERRLAYVEDILENEISKLLVTVIKTVKKDILDQIEGQGYVRYAGTWDADAEYARGTLITHDGSGWIATGPVTKGAKPGRAAEWRLAVKSGAKEPALA